ncbi:MAG: BAX inhibitor (BI)-1/YccA family protein, partial [Gammaproteobacteria bacterium]|nr:BAX inhibitor (BI)-1/YccA family protein [Gammaproteobacteria bacterium]
MANAQFVTDRQSPVVSTNKVLRNTYFLLSMTLIFSAAMAGFAIATDAPYMGWIPLLVAFGLLFAISKMRNSVWGILL